MNLSTLTSTTQDDAQNFYAKQSAFASLNAQQPILEPTAIVEYHSRGQLLIIGNEDKSLALAASLSKSLSCSILICGNGFDKQCDGIPVSYTQGEPLKLTGHLGAFQIEVGNKSIAQRSNPKNKYFDLILD